MLSYQHTFHAGCMADVHKHTLLIRALRAEKTNRKPLNFIDTHAGRGVYDLSSEQAQKTGEAAHGILSLLEKESETLAPLKAMLGKTKENQYPGSAKIMQLLSGKEDTFHFFELHSTEFKELKNRFNLDDRIKLHHDDGFDMAYDNLYKKRKNFVFIDPSYEIKVDYEDVVLMINELLDIAPDAIIMLWVPHLPKGYHKPLMEKLKADERAALSTFRFTPMNDRAMYASSVAVWNAPEGANLEFNL